MYNETEGPRYDGQVNLEKLVEPDLPSMSLRVQSSFFEDNHPLYGVINMVRTNAFFNKAVFQHNAISPVGVMALSKGSQLAISGACFVHNSGFWVVLSCWIRHRTLRGTSRIMGSRTRFVWGIVTRCLLVQGEMS